MEIEGFTEDHIAALIKIWNLGNPIDPLAFCERTDIPAEAKARVKEAGYSERGGARGHDAEASPYRLMQAQVIREVAKLDKERWHPLGAS